MPHIPSDDKPNLNGLISELSFRIETKGELNYTISMLVDNFVKDKGEKYDTLCDGMGTFIGALLEYYRLVVAKYEDGAIERNGNAYE